MTTQSRRVASPVSLFLIAVALLAGFFAATVNAQEDGDWDSRVERALGALQEETAARVEALRERIQERMREAVRGMGQNAPADESPDQPEPAARPWLGLAARAASPEVLARAGLRYGLEITDVTPGGPADQARLRARDILITANGRELISRDVLRDLLAEASPGDVIQFTAQRVRRRVEVALVLGTREDSQTPPSADQNAATNGWLGVRLGVRGNVFVITEVVDDSPASQAGLQRGDRLVQMDTRRIDSIDAFREAMAAHRVGDRITMVVLRGRRLVSAAVEIAVLPDGEESIPTPEPMEPEQPVVPPTAGGLNLPRLPGSLDRQLALRLNQLNQQGVEGLRSHDWEAAEEAFRAMIELDENNDTALYNLACMYSLQGRIEEALDMLERSVYAGFIDFNHIREDSDLDNLREEPRYLHLLESRDDVMEHLAEQRVEDLREFFAGHDDFIYRINREDRLIYATSYGEDVLDALENELRTYAHAQWEHLFTHRPDHYITIVIPSRAYYSELVPNPSIGGYYSPENRTLLASGINNTLIHEFTHALHFGELAAVGQAQQIWFLEGMATCFETSAIIDGVATPLPSARLAQAQMVVEAGRYVPFERFMRQSQPQFMQNALVNYAQARSVCVWLFQEGKLQAFLQAYEETWSMDSPEDVAGITAMRQVFDGETLEEIQARWLQWIRELPPFRGQTGEGGPVLGVMLEDSPMGPRITEVRPDTGAEAAGLQADDVILYLEGRRVISQNVLVDILINREVGDVVTMIVLRNGEQLEVEVTLTARQTE